MKHIGVTGTRMGLSQRQHLELAKLLDDTGEAILHHGDCVGADAEVHAAAAQRNWTIVVHPPANSKFRAFCAGDEVLPEDGYLNRNRDIVKESEVLWAFPEGVEENFPRSGTWMTVRFARAMHVPVVVVLP